MERDLNKSVKQIRPSGWVRFFTHELEPKSEVNTSSSDIASQILYGVLSTKPESFVLDDRSERREIRFHWKALPDGEMENILKECITLIRQNEISQKYNYDENIMDIIINHLKAHTV